MIYPQKIKPQSNNNIQICLVLFFLFCCFGLYNTANLHAEEESLNLNFSIRLDQATIAKGYTVSAFEDKIKLSLVPEILSEATPVEVIELHENLPMPWSLDRVSEVYQFEFKNKVAYDDHKPFYIQMSYNSEDADYKKVYFYDKNFSSWRPLPTTDHPDSKFVRSLIHLPFARIAVFSFPGIMTSGRASWYGYKGGNFAASPDFTKDSRLRVFNYDKSKFVDVIINDWGPDRSVVPDRAIDLDKIAFAKLAPLGAGVIDVSIEPLYIAPDSYGRVLGVYEKGVGVNPEIDLKSAIVFDETTGSAVFSKNINTVLPLASLTKLVAIKVFLDTKPSLNTVASYSIKDEEYNHEFCEPWESAKLNLADGDTLTTEDLLYASLVGSANNTIETLVRVSGLKRDEFIKKMNDSAVLWGATSSRFVEPTGLAPENMTTALDYAIISREVLKNPIIQKSSSIEEYKFSTINTEKPYRIKNTNKIIKTLQYNISGSKTGYLDEAGYCLMVRVAVPGGKSMIVVSLGAETREQSFYETEELIKFGLRNL